VHVIDIHLRASNTFSEVFSETTQEVECIVEVIVGCALLQIFTTIFVEEVSVCYFPPEDETENNSTESI
jgi:hypothetical protein